MDKGDRLQLVNKLRESAIHKVMDSFVDSGDQIIVERNAGYTIPERHFSKIGQLYSGYFEGLVDKSAQSLVEANGLYNKEKKTKNGVLLITSVLKNSFFSRKGVSKEVAEYYTNLVEFKAFNKALHSILESEKPLETSYFISIFKKLKNTISENREFLEIMGRDKPDDFPEILDLAEQKKIEDTLYKKTI